MTLVHTFISYRRPNLYSEFAHLPLSDNIEKFSVKQVQSSYSKCKWKWLWNKFYYDGGKESWISCSGNHGPGRNMEMPLEFGILQRRRRRRQQPCQVGSISISISILDPTPTKCNTIVSCKKKFSTFFLSQSNRITKSGKGLGCHEWSKQDPKCKRGIDFYLQGRGWLLHVICEYISY